MFDSHLFFDFASQLFSGKDSADVMFFNCVLFAKDKNIPTDLLTKGKEVFVKGFMRPNNYTKDGKTFSGFQVVAEKIRSMNE